MARIPIEIGVANAGDGNTLFDAFTAVEANFVDLYNDDTGDVRGVLGTAPIAATVASNIATVSLNDLGVTSGKLAANSVITDKITDLNVTTAKLANDSVTHDKLENRYTQAVTVSTLTGTYSLDWSTAAVFVMSGSLTGGITFQFSNMKIGQTIDIYNLTGSQTVTFSTASGTPVFNKCGGVDYAAASTNLIQVQCVSDASNAVFNYAVSAYVSDSTPS